MVITEISSQKKKGRYNIYVDYEFYSGIDAEAIIKFQLKEGIEIEQEKLENIVIDAEKRSAFDKLVDIISRQYNSKSEIKNKLIKKGYNIKAIDLAIKQAEDYGYINDLQYAESLVKSKSNKSRAEIKQILFQKGVDKNIIQQTALVISPEQEKENVIKLAQKYMKNKQPDQKVLQSLYAYLFRRGFDRAAINSAIRLYKQDFEGEE